MVETQECFYFKIFNPLTCIGAPRIQKSLGASKRIKDTYGCLYKNLTLASRN